MSAPLVSVIVPTYNRVEDVYGAIESVLAQTLADFELIVIDDGSTDETPQRVPRDFGSDPRVQYHYTENGGTAVARNRGLDLARGRFVGLLDSDDRYLPEFLASQVEVLERERDVQLVHCDGRYLNAAGEEVGTVFTDAHFRPPMSFPAMCDGAWGLPSCSLYRRDALGPMRFDATFRYSEDTELLFRFLKAGNRCVLNHQVLTLYRYAEKTETEAQKTGDPIRMEEDHLRMMELHCPDHPRTPHQRYWLARRRAKVYMKTGKYREARAPLWAWWRHRPWSRSVNRLLLRAYLGRPPNS